MQDFYFRGRVHTFTYIPSLASSVGRRSSCQSFSTVSNQRMTWITTQWVTARCNTIISGRLYIFLCLSLKISLQPKHCREMKANEWHTPEYCPCWNLRTQPSTTAFATYYPCFYYKLTFLYRMSIIHTTDTYLNLACTAQSAYAFWIECVNTEQNFDLQLPLSVTV